jgi:ribosome maturation factor RimP
MDGTEQAPSRMGNHTQRAGRRCTTVSVEERVESLLSPIVATLDVELLDVTFAGGILRLTIDGTATGTEAGRDVGETGSGAEGGITTDQLAAVNRLVGPVLDQHDPIPGRYTLEVSSPGLERPLSRPGHFHRAIGEVVVVKMAPGLEPRRYKGELTAVDDEAATVSVTEIDGVDLDEPRIERLELGDVDRARTVFEWGPQPKPGGGGKRTKNKRTKQQRGNRDQAGKSARSRGVR